MPHRLAFTRLSVREQPLVFLTSAFIGGELLAARVALAITVWSTVTAVWWLLAGWLYCRRRLKRRREWLITTLVLAGCFASGGLLWRLNEAGVSGQSVRQLLQSGWLDPAEPVELWGIVQAAPELAADRIYLSLSVERVASLGRESQASGLVQLVVPFHDAQARLDYDALGVDYGVRLRGLAFVRKSGGYRNPGAPNFDELLESRGYDATGAVKSPLLIERLAGGGRNPLLAWLYSLRARAVTRILRSLTQPTAGIVVAALFGNQHFLSQPTAEAFRASGTYHLLVISGLHVALIALVALRLAALVWQVKAVQYGSVLALIWSYALMVGAQPAVTRATVMLSVTLVGQLLFRATAGANTLAASALILLVWQPRELSNPAFQLSFLTVLIITAVVAPVLTRLRHIGQWQPSEVTPYPPRVPAWVRWVAEVLYWNEAEFRGEMRRAAIRYRLEKAVAARRLSFTRSGRIVQWCLAWGGAALWTTTSVQVGLLPLMIANFHRVSFISPITNVIQSALMFALMLAGSLHLFVSSISPRVTRAAAGLVDLVGWLTVRSADPVLRWSRLSFRVPDYGDGSAPLYALYFTLILLFIVAANAWNPFAWPVGQGIAVRGAVRGEAGATPHGVKSGRRWTAYGLGAVGCALGVLFALLVWHPFPHEYQRGRLSVTFLDVGQGDSMLVSFPQGGLMLLDAGGRLPSGARASPEEETEETNEETAEAFVEDRVGIGEAAIAPYLWRRGIKRLDLVVASHGHSDHTQGFGELARSFGITAAICGMMPTNDEQFNDFRRAMEAARVPLRSLPRGQRLEIDGVRVEALAPFPEEAQAEQNGNNQSLVLRLSYGGRVFLLTGDIEREVEQRLVKAGEALRADVLKVAHHGSRTSTTPEFLQRVQPQHAVISVAAPSPFDHPHAETLANLRRVKASVWQTSKCGAITISTDGADLRVETFARCDANR